MFAMADLKEHWWVRTGVNTKSQVAVVTSPEGPLNAKKVTLMWQLDSSKAGSPLVRAKKGCAWSKVSCCRAYTNTTPRPKIT